MVRRLALVLALVLAVGAAPAAADTAPAPPTLRTERTWFTCVDDLKVQNVALAQGRLPSWGTTAPVRSVTDGAGCGYYENAVGAYLGPNRTTLDAEWQGPFTGNLERITVELHAISASAGRATGTLPIRVNLFVDGVEVYGVDAPDVRLSPEPSPTRASERMAFTFTGIGLRTEEGDGVQRRTIRLVVRSLTEAQTAWVWDTTEVPAGLVFNPTTAEAVTLPARRPGA